MGNYLELFAAFSIMFTAVMLLVLEVIDSRREKEEERMKEFKEAHEEVKKRWKEEGN